MTRFFGLLAVILVISTILILLFVKEKNDSTEYVPNVKETYQQIVMICMLKPVLMTFAIFCSFTLLRCCISQGGLWLLKMQDSGSLVMFVKEHDIRNYLKLNFFQRLR